MLGFLKRKNSEESTDEVCIRDGAVIDLSPQSPSPDDSPLDTPFPEDVSSEETSFFEDIPIEKENPPDEVPANETITEEFTEKITEECAPEERQPDNIPPLTSPETPLPETTIPDIETPEEDDTYPPLYLTHGDGKDYEDFLLYLKEEGKARRTQTAYGMNLRHLRIALAERMDGSHELSVPLLNAALQSVSDHKALGIKYTLSSYAKYRHHVQGDSRLLFLLTSHAHEIHTPSRTQVEGLTRNPMDRLTEEEAASYEDLGRYFCRKGRRDGVWLSLCLVGVKPGEIRHVDFPNKSSVGFLRRGKLKVLKIPAWLYKAMQEIPNWRIGRKHIYEELKVLGVTPNTLNADARAREKREAKRKKEEEQDIQRMVKQWRKSRKK